MKKKRRKNKSKKYFSKNKKKHSNQPHKPKPYEVIKHNFFEVPNPFKNRSKEEVLKEFISIGKNAEKLFNSEFTSIKDWFEEYDGLYILSYFFVYFTSSPEGIDKEAIEGKLDFYYYYLEILQAFSLMQERSLSVKPLQGETEVLLKSLQNITKAFHDKNFLKITPEMSEEDYKKQLILSEMRVQTAAIRNNAYSSQQLSLTSIIYEKVTQKFEEHYNLDPIQLINAFFSASQFVEERLNEHLRNKAITYHGKNIQDVIGTFLEYFDGGSSEEELKALYKKFQSDLESFKAHLVMYTDISMWGLLTFSSKDFAILYGDESKTNEFEKVLDIISYSFGDLKDENPEFFILDNPILQKPFIKVSDELYFSSMFGIIGHITPIIMETLVRNVDENFLEKLQKAKAKVLEEETQRLFEENCPNAEIYQGVSWTDPLSGKQYENDLLLVIDRFALAVENKSGAIDPPAKRGAEFRFIQTLQTLVIDAAEQANRLISHMIKINGSFEFKTADGITRKIDTSLINHYVPLSVTLESLGLASANLKRCVEAGLISGGVESFIPSMSVTDLEIILTILRNEVEVIHYFTRRSQIERDLVYIGDEHDLFATYLDTGFNFGEVETDLIPMIMLMKSKELDPYFVAMARGVSVSKPRLVLTQWWKDIIKFLIDRKVEYWSEIGYVLLNISKDDQKTFERKFKNLCVRVENDLMEQPHNWVMYTTLPENRSYVLVGFPYRVKKIETRDAIITNNILNGSDITDNKLGVVCIGSYVKENHYPYSIIAYAPMDSQLFKPKQNT